MIREVYVNGYRSLHELKIPIRPGLNILVGPNGGGKTNILSFFEFLSKLSDTPADEAVSSHGGIGRVFTRIPDNRYKVTMEAAIRGSISFRMRGGEVKVLWYTWKFTLSASIDYDEIRFGSQRLYIDLQSEPRDPEHSDLILAVEHDENGSRLRIDKMVISRLQYFFRGFTFLNVGTYISFKEAARVLTGYTRNANFDKQCIVSTFPPHMTIFRQISADIGGGEIFNFVPEVCKQPEDSARPPVMDKSGAGLASTLYRLARPASLPYGPFRNSRRLSNDGQRRLDKIAQYVRLVSPSVQSMNTERNPIDNTISAYVTILDEDGEVSFPLAQCSDGTVKWIALLTKVITANSGFSIEEPENFLHPAVQREFVNVVRTEAENNRHAPYTLITTHSESLINEALPSEVILVWMDGGKTVARRVSNSENIINEINRTGFGLGYYYAAGALEGA
jgi:predicted ATPase